LLQNVGNAASKRLRGRRREPLNITETIDATAVVVGVASMISAFTTVRWLFGRRKR
jgi:hypothetical protein